MKVLSSLEAFQAERPEMRGKLGFVPTMGALHEGHLSLLKLAKKHADTVVTSIYVNPTQFAPHEDFDSYPRDIEDDLMQLKGLADIVYLPQTEEIYPDGAKADLNTDDFGDAGKGLETEFRPHFFHGVASVVSRLFDAVKPDIAVFGEKDYQQLQVIREMVAHQKRDIEIIGGPIVRDDYGLALSSRNAYLSEEELEIARMLNQILYKASQDGDLDDAREMILTAGFDKIDYVEKRWGRVLGAAWLGKTRLIDNVALEP